MAAAARTHASNPERRRARRRAQQAGLHTRWERDGPQQRTDGSNRSVLEICTGRRVPRESKSQANEGRTNCCRRECGDWAGEAKCQLIHNMVTCPTRQPPEVFCNTTSHPFPQRDPHTYETYTSARLFVE